MTGDKFGFLAAALTACTLAGCIAETAEVAPVIPVPAHGWEWVPMDTMLCRDGSTTGYGINKPAVESDKILYMLEGGGACFNIETCAQNPFKAGLAEFAAYTEALGNGGIFNRDIELNPFKDWNYIFVPYCTGDVHAGANPDFVFPGTPGPGQKFVGYSNIEIVVTDVKERFPNITRGVLSGFSAGGLGVLANYVRFQGDFYPNTPFDFLDDSGPPMSVEYIAPCLQFQLWNFWGLKDSIGHTCPACTELDFAMPMAKTVVEASIKAGTFGGFIDSAQDGTMRMFYGFGNNDCKVPPFVPPDLGAAKYEEGLLAGIAELNPPGQPPGHYQSFVFVGTNHTSIESDLFYLTEPDPEKKLDARVSGPDDTPLLEWTLEYLAGIGGNLQPKP